MAGALCFLCTFPLSACQDRAGDPLALAVAPETHGALLLSQALPSVPILLSEAGLAPEDSAEVEAWWESWKMVGGEGERVRSRIYPSAAQRLFPALGEAGLRVLLGRNQENLRAVEHAGLLGESEAIRSALAEARALHDRADGAIREGDPVAALALALQSVDALWAVSPPQVASSLLEEANRSLRRNTEVGAYSEEQLNRIRRLTRGAEEAMQAGDYPRAIRRAYYACQLLGVDPL